MKLKKPTVRSILSLIGIIAVLLSIIITSLGLGNAIPPNPTLKNKNDQGFWILDQMLTRTGYNPRQISSLESLEQGIIILTQENQLRPVLQQVHHISDTDDVILFLLFTPETPIQKNKNVVEVFSNGMVIIQTILAEIPLYHPTDNTLFRNKTMKDENLAVEVMNLFSQWYEGQLYYFTAPPENPELRGLRVLFTGPMTGITAVILIAGFLFILKITTPFGRISFQGEEQRRTILEQVQAQGLFYERCAQFSVLDNADHLYFLHRACTLMFGRNAEFNRSRVEKALSERMEEHKDKSPDRLKTAQSLRQLRENHIIRNKILKTIRKERISDGSSTKTQ